MSNFAVLNQDCLEALKELPDNSIDSLITDPPAGISFMGKAWDDDFGGRKQWIAWMSEVMIEALRVMKPGAHGLVWAIPRTSHWTATALEDAGFEIRDVVTHLFGSGFPKSLDISKAIDKAVGAEREVIGLAVNSYPDSGRKDTHRKGGGKIFDNGEALSQNVITAPATDAAKQWQGWGTGLKPASEHWILVRKPCSEKTVAANVIKWGTGAINIDASRVAINPNDPNQRPNGSGTNSAIWKNSTHKWDNTLDMSKGRFPANLVLSCSDNCTEDAHDMFNCPIALLDEQSGISKSTGGKPKNAHNWMLNTAIRDTANIGGLGDVGGASRFFYCAKASKREKNTGCGTNTHPTVKSTKLMTYLITMITPLNGVVLDPFMGSGTTGVAALTNNFAFIGIEKEREYFEIAEARLNNVAVPPPPPGNEESEIEELDECLSG